jgi:ferric-dicitrate binding protein FerR (iron transport regulator)
MKTKKLEKWLLLEQSGELSPGQLRRLGRELAVSSEARRLRTELNVLSSSIHKPDIELSPRAVSRIAARLREEGRPMMRLSIITKPVLALAACLAFMLGVWNFHDEQASSASTAVIAAAGVDVWNVPFEEDLSRLENLIVAISGDPLDIMDM